MAKISTYANATPVDADYLLGDQAAAGPTTKTFLLSAVKTYVSNSPTLVTPNIGTPTAGVATNLTGLPLAGNGYIANIQGLELAYNSAAVLRILVGKAMVNGTWASLAQTDYTSGSTMKDIANATVTLGNSKCYWVFFSSGGVIGIEINDGTGDGATPVWDATVDYWKAASTGAAWRRIGKFWTDGSGNIFQFQLTNFGRYRQYAMSQNAALILINNVVDTTSFTNFTITPYVTGDDAQFQIVPVGASTSTRTNCGTDISLDGGTTTFIENYTAGFVASGGGQTRNTYWVPYVTTPQYRTAGGGANINTYIFLSGVAIFV